MRIGEVVAQVRALKRWVIDNFAQTGWTTTASVSPLGDADEVQVADGEPAQRPGQRVEPFGLRSVPTKGLRALSLRIGSSNVVFLGVAPLKAQGPTGLGEGETALYNAFGCTVVLDKNGKVTITDGNGSTATLDGSGAVALANQAGAAATLTAAGDITLSPAAAKKVVLAGGVLPVARQTDTAGPYPIVGGNPLILG